MPDIHGTLAITLDDVTDVSSVGVGIIGSATATLGAVAISATATDLVSATLAGLFDDTAITATGTAAYTPITGTLSVTLDDMVVSPRGGTTATVSRPAYLLITTESSTPKSSVVAPLYGGSVWRTS